VTIASVQVSLHGKHKRSMGEQKFDSKEKDTEIKNRMKLPE
jgi:hypothetical protein